MRELINDIRIQSLFEQLHPVPAKLTVPEVLKRYVMKRVKSLCSHQEAD